MKYCFVFGYETPLAASANSKTGSDFETIGSVWINAASTQDAAKIGEEFVNWYVSNLFDDPSKRWTDEDFAAWVETNPDEGLILIADRLPPIEIGENPDFATVREALRD